MTKGLDSSDEPLKMGKSMQAFAVAAGMPLLVFFALFSLAFVAVGIFLVAIGDIALGLAAVGIFGAMALLYLYAIYLKRTASRQLAS